MVVGGPGLGGVGGGIGEVAGVNCKESSGVGGGKKDSGGKESSKSLLDGVEEDDGGVEPQLVNFARSSKRAGGGRGGPRD